MIERVKIESFQSLVDVGVTLGKLTVLSGPSNSGKSAFVRALRSLVTNPRGDWYMRDDSPSTTVSVVLDDAGARVTFGRVKSVYYEIGYPESDTDYTAVGTNVPDEVSALLRIDPEIQITDQFDQPFLLNVSPSQVAKVLGAITRSDKMIKATQAAGQRSREAKSSVATITSLIIEDRENLERRFGWYVPAAEAVRQLAVSRDALAALRERLSALSALRSRLVALAPALAWEMPGEALQLSADADGVGSRAAVLERLVSLRADLARWTDDLQHREHMAYQLGNEIELAEQKVDHWTAQLTVCPTCEQPLLTSDARAHVLTHV